MVDGLLRGLEDAAADDHLRAVVVTNTGPVFSAGADLRRASDAVTVATGPRGLMALLEAVATSPLPVVGRIDGDALGGGLGLAAACDIAVAREDATFGFPEVRLGAIPGVLAPLVLAKVRRADVVDAFLRGHRFPATRAAAIGLIAHAVPADRLDATVELVLADLRAGAPGALAACKRLLHDLADAGRRADAAALAAARSAEVFAGSEAQEGVAAFLERRRPRWDA
jgi:methylglutaconyl-CoA hydratase